MAFWMVLVAALIPYFTVAVSKYRPDYDNAAPRAQAERSGGARQRAWWAHLNAFEAFPPFAAGVIIAHMTGASPVLVDGLAVAFVLLRVLYAVLYVTDRPTARSLVWTAAFGCVVGLFVVAALG
ncbi:MAG: MAPEG family protein [Pseudomonadota bacterium]|jgi:uncharacterized MAPEG superfamily protein